MNSSCCQSPLATPSGLPDASGKHGPSSRTEERCGSSAAPRVEGWPRSCNPTVIQLGGTTVRLLPDEDPFRKVRLSRLQPQGASNSLCGHRSGHSERPHSGCAMGLPHPSGGRVLSRRKSKFLCDLRTEGQCLRDSKMPDVTNFLSSFQQAPSATNLRKRQNGPHGHEGMWRYASSNGSLQVSAQTEPI